jgi:hypothetical protein
MYRIVKEEGMGIDAVSPGEIHTALSAGFPAEKIFFHGDGKTDADIRYALEQGVGNNLGIGGYKDNLELTLIYELPLEHFPASLSWNTFVAGDDFNLDGSRAFSSYAELRLPCRFNNFCVCATAGAVPYKSEGIYKNTGGFKFINLNLRTSYTFTAGENFELPLYAQYNYNPLFGSHFFVLGFSIMFLSL